jgi:DNA-binding NarL/FixJ family response regulator
MDTTHIPTVMVIENDADFRALLDGIFERSELFDLVGSYDSIEGFGAALLQNKPFAEWIPELMVVDVMSSSDPRTESTSLMSALRSEGLNFATLFVSSMEFGALLRVLRKSHPEGWAVLQKTSRLSEQDIIEVAIAVCNELKSK